MAAVAAGLIGPAIDVVKWVGRPILRQLQYLCCFTANITNLGSEAKKLDNAAGDLQDQVDTARNNQQVINRDVESWLQDSQEINSQKNEILDKVRNESSGCLKLGSRFLLSKRAKKMSDRMKELREQRNFASISHEGPPAATRAVPLGNMLEFGSRKRFEEDIITTLRVGEKKMIGICGMGGLGKTTMAKKIMNRVLEEKIFEEAVIAVVSQQVDKIKIQDEISGLLKLHLPDKNRSQARVQTLHARLSGTKRILLVLDDVWDALKLEDLGVPCDPKIPSKCTVLITSRNKDALDAMNVQKVFGMKVLNKEEAWSLFRERAGTCVDDNGLNSIAREVVKECNGLPISLTTVGAALKDEKMVSIWKDALGQLRQSKPDEIPDYIENVYNPLKLSYDSLKTERAKSLFLLCCLFKEDDDIPLETLTYFSMGLVMFQGIRSLEEARNKMFAWTKTLKSRSLLLDGNNDYHVRMHDVVRDVCIFIAKQEGKIGGNDCTWISSVEQLVGETSELPPTRLRFPNLRLLILTRPYNSKGEEFELDSAFLEGSRDLCVLHIKNYNSLTSLPHTTDSLTNLHTLVLVSCKKLKTISFVGKLVNLEILICRWCSSIEELPLEMKNLKRLKLLELSGCDNLRTIGGIISSLVGLEELKMRGSFKKWEAEDSELKQNARLRELEALTKLTHLEIDIEDPALAYEQIQLSSKLQIFNISFSPLLFFVHQSSHKSLSLHLRCSFSLNGETSRLGDWVEVQLLRETECLHLRGEGANNVDLSKCQNIKLLRFGECEAVTNLNLLSQPSLKNLSSIEIRNCPQLRNLGQLTIAGKDCLPQLQLLCIWNCEMMEQVFIWDENTDPQTIPEIFPKLEKIELRHLPNLATLCQGIPKVSFGNLETLTNEIPVNLRSLSIGKCDEEMANGGERTTAIPFPELQELIFENLPKIVSFCEWKCDVELPSLTDLFIMRCPSMKCFLAAPKLEHFETDWNHDLQLGDNVSFDRLKKLKIGSNGHPFYYHKLFMSLVNSGVEELSISWNKVSMSLVPASIAGTTFNCRVLRISSCYKIEKVIDDEDKVVSGAQRTLLFPYLEELILTGLPRLLSFCEWTCDIELPSLRRVEIEHCPNLKYFSLGPLATPKLEILKIDSKDIGAEKNLNGALQQSYLARAKEEQGKKMKESGVEGQEGTGEIEEEQK